jgi:hypothetical protein
MIRGAAKNMGPESVQTGLQMWGITCTGRFLILYQFSKVLTDSRGRNSRPDNHRLVGQASRLSRNDGQDARSTKSLATSVITFENRYRARPSTV